jgi:hypothetical protein
MPKQSRLAENFQSGFQMVKTKWQPNHSKTGHKSGFQMVGPSLDHFIKKIVTNKIFFMPKRSRLEVKKTSVRFSNGKKQNGGHLITGPKKCPKNGHLNTGQSGIRWDTVVKIN